MAPRHNVFSDCVWIPGTGRGPEQSTIWVHTPKTGQFRVFHTISVEPDRSVCSSILQPNTCGISPDPSCHPLFPPRSRRLIQSYKFTCNPSNLTAIGERVVPWNIELEYRRFEVAPWHVAFSDCVGIPEYPTARPQCLSIHRLCHNLANHNTMS